MPKYKEIGKLYFKNKFQDCKKVIEDSNGKNTVYSSWIAAEIAQKDGIKLNKRDNLEKFMIGFEEERDRIMY